MAQIPERLCGARVGRATVTYPCSLPSGHEGPHYAIENVASRQERDRWEQARRHEASPLAQFQGPAQTTAERYTERSSVTPVPQSEAVLRADAAEAHHRLALGDIPVHASAAIPEDAFALAPTPAGTTVVNVRLMQTEDRAEVQFSDGTSKIVALTRIEEAVEAPTKQRPGDQPLPTSEPSEHDVQSLVIADIEARRQVGIKRYGQGLQTFNGRDTLLDAYEETLDQAVYLRSLMEAQRATLDHLIDVSDAALRAANPGLTRATSRSLAEQALMAVRDALAAPLQEG